MMVLLDTHVFLWFILDDSRLSARARETIMGDQNEVFLSPASYWELAIKISMKKYELPGEFVLFLSHQLELNDITILPISVEHAGKVSEMPFHHRDPFDRMIAAQALVEALPVISKDDILDKYGVQRIW